jgi:protein transport protein HofC
MTQPLPMVDHQFTVVHLMILIAFCAVLFYFCALPGGMAFFAFLLVLGIPSAVVGLVVVLLARRRTQQDALLWVMAIALERRMPLAPGVVAVSDQFGVVFRNRLLALAAQLDDGVALPQALALVPGLLPRQALVLIRLGWETETLPAAVREAADMRPARGSNRDPLARSVAYLVAMLLFIQGIGGFLAYFVLPKFESIAADFGIQLPTVTVLFAAILFSLSRTGITILVGLVEFAFLVYLPLHYFGWLRIPLPYLSRLMRRRHMILVQRGLAMVVENGKPLTDGVEVLARFYPEKWMRKRLARSSWCMEQGGHWYDCLRWQGLLRPAEAAVLASAERAGNLPWALRELAESGNRRLDYRLQLWAQILFIAVVLGLGALVFFIIISFYAPLIMIIERLMP